MRTVGILTTFFDFFRSRLKTCDKNKFSKEIHTHTKVITSHSHIKSKSKSESESERDESTSNRK